MFTDRLTFGELLSIVVAAPPGSSVHDVKSGGWSREAHLLANLQESNAGLVELPERYERPGTKTGTGGDKAFKADDYDMDELDALLAANYALGPTEKVG